MDKNLHSFILIALVLLFGYLFVNTCACKLNLGFKEPMCNSKEHMCNGKEHMCNGKEHFTTNETPRKNFNF
jgi:hypothetical protein